MRSLGPLPPLITAAPILEALGVGPRIIVLDVGGTIHLVDDRGHLPKNKRR